MPRLQRNTQVKMLCSQLDTQLKMPRTTLGIFFGKQRTQLNTQLTTQLTTPSMDLETASAMLGSGPGRRSSRGRATLRLLMEVTLRTTEVILRTRRLRPMPYSEFLK